MQFGMTACLMQDVPKNWPEGHRWSSDWEEVTCPACKEGKEPIETFVIGRAKDQPTITCKRCNRTSYSLDDVTHRWCAYCQAHHDSIWPPARRFWITHPEPALKIVRCRCGFWIGFNQTDAKNVLNTGLLCPECRANLMPEIKNMFFQ